MDSIGNRLSELDFSDQCVAEARRLYKDSVLTALRLRVKVRCRATYIANALVIQLLEQDGTELYRHVVRDINNRIYVGEDSEKIAVSIVNDFKSHLLKKYFKHSYCKQGRNML